MPIDESTQDYGLHRLINSGAMKYLDPDEVRNYIREHHSDVNERDDRGMTPLHEAAQFGLHDIAKLLIAEFGADVNAQSDDEWTPLIEACLCNSTYSLPEGAFETVKVLMEHGADPSIKCSKGRTAIEYAAETYFDRTICNYLSKREMDASRIQMIARNWLGRKLTIRLKNGIKYGITNYKLCEPTPGEVIHGKLSAVCRNVEFFKEYPASTFDVRPDNAILRIYALNKEGIRTWDFHQFHIDDVEILHVSDERSDHDYEGMCGSHIRVMPASSALIYYELDDEIQQLNPGESIDGLLWQMTGRLDDYCYEMAHIRTASGQTTLFFADEIFIKKS